MSSTTKKSREELREEVFEAVEERDVPVAVTTHIAKHIDEETPRVRKEMEYLVAEGDLHSMQAGVTKVYWVPDDEDEAMEYIRGGSNTKTVINCDGEETLIGPCAECDSWIREGERAVSVLDSVNHDGNLVIGEGPADEEVYHSYCFKELLA